jgi:hypothetical protein
MLLQLQQTLRQQVGVMLVWENATDVEASGEQLCNHA